MENKKRQAHVHGMNKSLFDIPLISNTGIETFTFLGKEYSIKGKGKNYNLDFIEEDRVLTTDVEVLPNGRVQNNRRLVMDMYTFTRKPEVITDDTRNKELPDNLEGVNTDPIDDETFNPDLFDQPMEITPENSNPKEVLNEKDARAFLDRVLGGAVPVRIKNKLVKIGEQGTEVYGAFSDGVIQLSRLAPKGIEFHEAYHVVETAYLTPGEIAALNRETVGKHGEPTNATIKNIKAKYPKWKLTSKEARQIALSEIRAEEYRLYESSKNDERLTFKTLGKRIMRFFRELVDYIVPMFSTKNAATIYSRISRGHYRRKSVAENIAKELRGLRNNLKDEQANAGLIPGTPALLPNDKAFQQRTLKIIEALNNKIEELEAKLAKEEANIGNKILSMSIKDFSKSVEETALEEAGFNIEDRSNIATALIEALITNKGGVRNIKSLNDIKINDNILKGYLSFIQKRRKEAGNVNVADNLEIIKDNIKHFYNSEDNTGLILDILEQYKIRIETEEDAKGNKDVSQAMSSHFEYSGKDNAGTNTKILLSFLVKKNEKGENLVDDRTGLNKIERFSIVWNGLEKGLSDITSYAEYTKTGEVKINHAFDLMMNKLEEMSSLVPLYTGLAARIKGLEENDQIRFFNAFSKASMNFVTAIVDKWAFQQEKEGEGIVNIEQSNTRFIDPAVQGRKFMIRKRWLENLKQKNFFILKDEEENLDIDTKVLDTILESWNSISAEYKAELKRMTRDMDIKVSQEYKQNLIEDLKVSGITLSEMALDILLSSENTEKESLTTLFLGAGRNFGVQDIYIRTAKSKRTGRNPYDFKSIKVRSENDAITLDLNFTENNPFSWASSAINTLAEAEALVDVSLGQSNILGPQGKSYWLYSLNNYLSKQSNRFNASKYERDVLLKDRWAKDSNWLKELISGAKLKIRTFNNLKLSNSKDEGTGNTDLTPSQEHAFRINSTLFNIARAKGLLSPPTMADKSVWNLIEGMKTYDIFENSDSGFILRPDGSMRVGHNIARKFAIYAASEISRVQSVHEDLFGQNALTDSQLIEYYHYMMEKGKKNRRKANGLKFILFPSLTTSILKDIGVMTEDGVFLDSWDSDLVIPKLTEFVKPILEKRILAEVNFAVENGVITKTVNKDTIIYKNNTIADRIIKLHGEKYKNKGAQFRSHYGIGLALANYTVNNMISFIETTKLLSGDPAFYKNLDDLSKRMPELIAPGQDLKIIEGHELFTVAVIRDQILPKSKYYDNYIKFLIEKKGYSRKAAKKILKPYLNVNVTDAQAYITLPRWRSLMRMLGKWDDKYDPTYFRLLNGEIVDDTNFDMLLAQPLKGMHYELRKGLQSKDGGTNLNIPTYLKYSQAVLIPAAIHGTELQKLLDTMNREGVDEVVFESGIKVGALSPVDIMQDHQTGELSSSIALNKFVLRNENWKLQQELSPHTENESLEGSQIKKSILSNIDLNADYIVPAKIVEGVQETKRISGYELVKDLHEIDRALSDIEKDAIINEWGISVSKVDDVTGQVMYNIEDYTKLHSILYSSFKRKKNTPAKLLKSLALNEAGSGFAIDISSHPFMRDIENMIGAMITDRLIKLKMPGGSFIQQSNFGMQRMAAWSDLSIKDQRELSKQVNEKGLSPLYYSKNGTVRAQIFLPSWFKEKHVPGHKKMSNEQIKKYIIDKRLLRAVGYRIPTQGMSSIDSFDIVGFLPKSMGDTAIVYDEFTSKTGADFDIDKLYLLLPSYAESKKGLYYVNYDGTKTIEENRKARGNRTNLFKKSLRNRKLELYQSILSSVHTFDQVINPLDSEDIKNNAAEVRYLKLKHTLTDKEIQEIEASKGTEDFYSTVSDILISKNDLEWFSPRYQMETKEKFLGGKFGVGQEARHLSDHGISQWSFEKEVESSYFLKGRDIGLGHITELGNTDLSKILSTNGLLISGIMSARLDAYVDIAKDPYIFYLNNNAITANTVALMDRAGVNPEWTNKFMGLKVITDYVKTQKYINSPGSPGVTINGKRIYKAEAVLRHRLLHEYSALTGTSVEDIKMTTLLKENKRVELYARRNKISVEDAMKKHTESPIRINDIIDINRLEYLLDSTKSNNANKIYDNLLLLDLFLNLKKTATSLNKAVTASKADTEGASGGIIGSFISDNAIDAVIEEDLIGGFEGRFDNTMLGKYKENGPNFMSALFGDTFLAGSTHFQNIMRDLSEIVGNKRILEDEDQFRKIYSSFVSYLFSKTQFYKNIDLKEILYSKNNVVNRLWRFKNEENSVIKDNLFIKYLSPEFSSTKRGHDYIITSATSRKEGIDKDALTEAWNDLLTHEDAKVRDFAEDLYKFSIISSGFSNTLFSFHELAPLQYELDQGIYDQFGLQVSELKSHGNSLFDETEIKKFLRTQTGNTELIPEAFPKKFLQTKINETKFKFIYHIVLPSNSAMRYITKEPKEGFKHFVPFIEVNIGKQTVLMEHIGYNEKGDAIYELTERLGTYSKGRKIFESPTGRTQVKENQITQIYKGKFVGNWLEQLRKLGWLKKHAEKVAKSNDGKGFVPLEMGDMYNHNDETVDITKEEDFGSQISSELDLNLMLTPEFVQENEFPVMVQRQKGPKLVGVFKRIGDAINAGIEPKVAIRAALKYNLSLLQYLRNLGPETLYYENEKGKYIGYGEAWESFKKMLHESEIDDIFTDSYEIEGKEYFFQSEPLTYRLEVLERNLITNSALTPIFNIIYDLTKGKNIEIVYTDQKMVKKLEGPQTRAFYETNTNRIFLPRNITAIRPHSKVETEVMVTLHEIIHQLTANSLHKNVHKKSKEEQLFLKRVQNLLDLYIQNFDTKRDKIPEQLRKAIEKYEGMMENMLPEEKRSFNYGEYAEEMNNVLDEFLAYGLTYKTVMKQLEGVKVIEEGPLFKGNLLSNIIDAIVDLFSSLVDKVLGKNAQELLTVAFTDFVKNSVSLDRTLEQLYDFLGKDISKLSETQLEIKDWLEQVSEKTKTRAKKKC
jgi:hypothetical protein